MSKITTKKMRFKKWLLKKSTRKFSFHLIEFNCKILFDNIIQMKLFPFKRFNHITIEEESVIWRYSKVHDNYRVENLILFFSNSIKIIPSNVWSIPYDCWGKTWRFSWKKIKERNTMSSNFISQKKDSNCTLEQKFWIAFQIALFTAEWFDIL